MKVRKFVSAISALTIAASAFAGMAVTASAAGKLFTDDCSTVSSNWDSAATLSVKNDSYLETYFSGSGNRASLFTIPDEYALTTGVTKVSFKYMLTNYTVMANRSRIQVALAADNASIPSYKNSEITNALISLDLSVSDETGNNNHTPNVLYLNNTACDNDEAKLAMTAGAWYTVTAYVNMDDHKMDYAITDSSGNEIASDKDVTVPADATKVKYLYFLDGRSGGTVNTDDIQVQNLTPPAFTLGSTSANIAVDENVNIDVTAITGTVKCSVDNSDIADISYDGGVLTITGKQTGVANVTVTAVNDGLTTSKAITVNVGEVQRGSITILHQDAAGNTIKSADKVDELPLGQSYTVPEEYKTAVDDVVINGIHYSAALSADSPASIDNVTDGATITLIYDTTEHVYDATVTSNPNTKITVSGTSTSGTAVSKDVVTNYAGTAAFTELPAGTYGVTGAKNGYSATASTLTVSADGSNSASVAMTITGENILYTEDFANGANFVSSAGQRIRDGKYQVYNLNETVVINDATSDVYTLTIPGVAFSYNNANYAARNAKIAVVSGETEIASVTANVTGSKVDESTPDGSTLNSVTVVSGTTTTDVAGKTVAGDLVVKLDTTKTTDNVTVTYAGVEYKGTTDATSITGIKYDVANQLYVAISSIELKGEEAEVVVAPTATRTQLYSGTTETGDVKKDTGSAWSVTVTPGTATIGTIGVNIDDVQGDKTISTSIYSGGGIVFAVAVNKTADQIGTFKVVLDDTTSIDATVAAE